MKKNNIDKKNFFIRDVIEKPNTKDAPSNNAVIGRYILPKTIFSKLITQKPGKGGEFHITDAIQSLIQETLNTSLKAIKFNYLNLNLVTVF